MRQAQPGDGSGQAQLALCGLVAALVAWHPGLSHERHTLVLAESCFAGSRNLDAPVSLGRHPLLRGWHWGISWLCSLADSGPVHCSSTDNVCLNKSSSASGNWGMEPCQAALWFTGMFGGVGRECWVLMGDTGVCPFPFSSCRPG